MKTLMILGRQPALGLAELESLYGASLIKPIGTGAAIVELEPNKVAFSRLGGSIKLTKILNELPSTSWHDIETYLMDTITEHLKYLPEGKLKLGLSVYGLNIGPKQINATGLKLKKIIRATGRSVRIVPNRAPTLNSAQVLYNQLTSTTGWELVLVKNGSSTLLCQTVHEQDIEAYAARDQNRPMRDAKVGMLPPKLAQIIINLAAGLDYTIPVTLLDPFCGTGVLLQEALLMDYGVYGTDLEPRMVEYSQSNLQWLMHGHQGDWVLEVADATTHTWNKRVPSIITCETYLGKPLSTQPNTELLAKIVADCDDIHLRFLKNIAGQINIGTRLCLAVPAWKTKTGFKRLPTLDKLSELGYTRRSFVHAKNEELIYHRPDQIVARELVVLQKK